MATIQMKVLPFEVPEYVAVEMPDGKTIDVEIKHLDEDNIMLLIEEFSTAVMAAAGIELQSEDK